MEEWACQRNNRLDFGGDPPDHDPHPGFQDPDFLQDSLFIIAITTDIQE